VVGEVDALGVPQQMQPRASPPKGPARRRRTAAAAAAHAQPPYGASRAPAQHRQPKQPEQPEHTLRGQRPREPRPRAAGTMPGHHAEHGNRANMGSRTSLITAAAEAVP